MASLVGIHATKLEYETPNYPPVRLGYIAYLLLRSTQNRGHKLCEVQTKNVVVSQRGHVPDKQELFESRFENAYKSSTVIADLRKGIASPRSIISSGSAFDGYCDEEKLRETYEMPNSNGYQILSNQLINHPPHDPYKAIDIYSDNMKGNMIIQIENGFLAIRDKTGHAPLSYAEDPEIGLYMVCSEDSSESLFKNTLPRIGGGEEKTIQELIGISGKKIFKEVEPGSMIKAQNGKLEIYHTDDAKLQILPHELLYIMHPASTFGGKSILLRRKDIGRGLGKQYKNELGNVDFVSPIPDSPRNISEGMWEFLYRLRDVSRDELFFYIDRSSSRHKQQRDIEEMDPANFYDLLTLNGCTGIPKFQERFFKAIVPGLIKGGVVSFVEDSILLGSSALAAGYWADKEGAKDSYFVSAEPPIVNELQVGIKSRRKNLVARELLSGATSIREMNERVSEKLGIKVLFNSYENLAESLGLKTDEIWVPEEIKLPFE